MCLLQKGATMKKLAIGLVVLGVIGVSIMAFAADEIVMSQTIQAQKGYLSVSKQVQNLKVTMAGDSYDQSIGTYTTNEAIGLSASVTTQGVAMFRNVSTDCVALVTAVFRLEPGQVVMGPLHTNSVTVQALTNQAPYTNGVTSVQIERIILEK